MLQHPPENILVVRTDAVGDLILSEPAAQKIKTFFPNCRLTYLVSEYTAPVLSGNPNIDNVICFPPGIFKFSYSNIRKVVSSIRTGLFDIAIVLRPTLFNALTIFLSGVPTRIGTGYRLYSVLFNERVFEHRKNNLKSEMFYNLSLLKPIGIHESLTENDIKPKVYVKKDSLDKAKAILRESGLSENDSTVVIHPGGRGSAPRWRSDRFLELAGKLSRLPGVKPVITGTLDDFTVEQKYNLQNLFKRNKGNIINLIGKTDLELLKGLIKSSKLVITNSTGTAHLAAGLGTMLVAIYPDSPDYSIKRWAPIGDVDRVNIISGTDLNSISTENVFSTCMKVLNYTGRTEL